MIDSINNMRNEGVAQKICTRGIREDWCKRKGMPYAQIIRLSIIQISNAYKLLIDYVILIKICHLLKK